ncbi:MAG: hypothetical protein ACLSWI_09395 [Candidatus Gastranaerophilaceae bacterium]
MIYHIKKNNQRAGLSNNYAGLTAFTLAEVLITLGIIGIIAAITIPNIVSAYKKKVVEVKLKRTYSVILNAVKASDNENGNLVYLSKPIWDEHTYYGALYFFDDYLKPYLKFIKDDGTKGSSYYAYANTVDGAPHNNGPADSGRTVILGDGTRVTFFMEHYLWPYNSNSEYKIGNLRVKFGQFNDYDYIGKNTFMFNLTYTKKGEGNVNISGYSQAGDNICESSALIPLCKSGNAAACTSMIQCNNWHIPDDYPVKF